MQVVILALVLASATTVLTQSLRKTSNYAYDMTLINKLAALKRHIGDNVSCQQTFTPPPVCSSNPVVTLKDFTGAPLTDATNKIGQWLIDARCQVSGAKTYLTVSARHQGTSLLTSQPFGWMTVFAADPAATDLPCQKYLTVGAKFVTLSAMPANTGQDCSSVMPMRAGGTPWNATPFNPLNRTTHWVATMTCPSGYVPLSGGVNCAFPSPAGGWGTGQGDLEFNGPTGVAGQWKTDCCVFTDYATGPSTTPNQATALCARI